LHLPYALGVTDADHPEGTGEVSAYAVRWTAIENDSGDFPTSPPMYYSVNRPDFRAETAERWPHYQADFKIAAGQPYAVHPFRLFDNQGRLTGSPTDPIGDPASGAPIAGQETQVWDVNGAPNDATSVQISLMLRTNPQVSALFASLSMPNPYTSGTGGPWDDIAFISDSSALPSAARSLLIAKIIEAVHARSLGYLWYIRSGDLRARLNGLPGGQNVTVRDNWSILNEFDTPDGLPSKLYEREGRRVSAVYDTTVTDLCPSYATDQLRSDKTCQTQPRRFRDAVALSDYPANLHSTGLTPPIYFEFQAPHGLPLRSLIPVGTRGLLVGGAIGADRLAYASFRVDPVRMMIGTALGEAVGEAFATHLIDFRRLNVVKLRELLADDYQETAFVYGEPWWNEATHEWRSREVGRAVQYLLAAGVLKAADPALELPSQVPLAVALRASPDLRHDLLSHVSGDGRSGDITTLRRLTGVRAARSSATLADAYIWLATRLVARR
jgi:hypothetical protein